MGRTAPRAPSQTFFSLLDADRPGGARADPQPPAAESTPSQHAHKATVPGETFKHCQGPRAGELLDRPALDAPAYKRPLRSNEEMHPTPSYLPDTTSPSLSLWFVDTCNAGEVLDARSTTAFDHLGASRR
jgi:hypothetical protein